MYRLGIDIGGTKIHIGIVRTCEEETRLLAVKRLLVTEIRDLSEEIRRAADDMCRELDISYADICSCGVGVPGTISRDGKCILKVPNTALLNEDFYDRLREKLSVPVRMVQDSRAAAWGEYLCGGGQGSEALICITLGTGIGTGIVIGGRIYHGALGAAGELGHIPVAEGGRPCGCGKRGCLEKYCAGGGLDITARELLGAEKSARDLFDEKRKGNILARAAIDDAVLRLGNAVVSAVNLLSPDRVLFSGGLCEEREFLEPLIEYIKEHCYSSSGTIPRVERAALGAFAPLVGAAMYHK